MGCGTSKPKQNQDNKNYRKLNANEPQLHFEKSTNDSSGRPVHYQQDQIENQVADEWLNAIKNENLKEGSLIFPPDDLAKDTNMGITTKNN